MAPIVLKLGGSLVTEKDRPETLDEAALDAAADAVAEWWRDRIEGSVPNGRTGTEGESTTDERPATETSAGLVLVHGAGSFGHHHADARGVTVERGTRDAGATMAIHGAMKRLNREVVDRLHERDLPALPVHPLSAAARDGRGNLTLPHRQVETMIEEGFVPVLHGDGVATAGEGITILSGDEVVVSLAGDLDADRIGLCSTVPGVFGEGGDVIDEIDSFARVRDALGGSDATDVTGGMAGKVRTLLATDAPAHVFGPDGLEAFLAGDAPGTVIRTERDGAGDADHGS